MPVYPFRLVSFDIDGTLTAGHGWRFIAERLGRLSEFEATNEAYREHHQTEDEHLRRLLAIARGTPLTQIHSILQETPKLPGIRETVDALRARGARTVLLSHNPRYVCEWYGHRFGFADWDGAEDGGGPEVVEGVVQSPGPVKTGKIAGLARMLDRYHLGPGESAHVGDGWADAELFPRVALGIALNSKLPEVNRKADVALQLADLRGLVPVLDRTTPKAVPRTLL